MFEGLQRGYWLCYCASDGTLDNVNEIIFDLDRQRSSRIIRDIDGRLFPTNVIKEIDDCRHFDEGLLLAFKKFVLSQKSKRNRDAMNSYIHIGYPMLRGYISDEGIETEFDSEATHEILRLANHCACWAVIGVAKCARNNSMVEEVVRISRSLR